MATQKDYARYAENVEELVGQGVNRDWLTENYGQNIENKARGNIRDAWQAQAGNVFSTGNIQGGTVPRPDDLLGIRAQIQEQLGIPEQQKAFQEQFAGLQTFDTATEEQQRQIRERLTSTNVIRGEQATASELRASERGGLSRALAVSQSALQASQQEAQFQFGIRQDEVNQKRQLILNNPEAGITFSDSFESAAKKIANYNEEREAKLKKDAEKQALKDAYFQLTGKMAEPMSTSRLRKKLKSAAKKANVSAKELADIEKALKLKALNATSGGDERIMQDEVVIDTSTGKRINTGNKVSLGTPTKFTSVDKDDGEDIFEEEGSWWTTSAWSPLNWFN